MFDVIEIKYAGFPQVSHANCKEEEDSTEIQVDIGRNFYAE